MRIALLAPDFPTEPAGTGPATYLHRMAAALLNRGHVPEVFTRSSGPDEILELDGIRVERVAVVPPRPLAALGRMRRLHPLLDIGEALHDLTGAVALARAFRRRDRNAPFDFIQASDWGLTGLGVRRRKDRPLVVRCCWSRDLFSEVERRPPTIGHELLRYLERFAVRRADVAYAPSEHLAGYLRRTLGIDVRVVRPPVVLECSPGEPPPDLPDRYLVHFGLMGYRKGTDLVRRALPLAWEEEPELRMVWVGAEHVHPHVEPWLRMLGDHRDKVSWLGPLPKAELYAVVQRAAAAVLPSRMENFPNTAIESLLLGVPVIGTWGSSLEEIVEHGVTGELVPPEDVERLAASMVEFWRGRRLPGGPSSRLAGTDPATAVDRLLETARPSGRRNGTRPEPRILILVPYFGPWPEWMPFFLESCRWNPTVDWLLLGDAPPPAGLPPNVATLPLALDELERLARRRLGDAVRIPRPYKLCDLRLAFGTLFEDLVCPYEVFGWSDVDVIYGDLRRFLTRDVIAHDVITFHRNHLAGHFTLVRNSASVRDLHLRVPGWREGVGDAAYMHLDEPPPEVLGRGLRVRAMESHSTPLSPLIPWRDGTFRFPQEWTWREGRLTNDLDGDAEFLYLHFMHWKGGPWARECGNAQWERLERVVHMDPARAGEGFRINERGIFPLAGGRPE